MDNDPAQQQQHVAQGNPGPPPIAPNPTAMTTVVNQQSMTNQQAQGMTSQHLMGLMANPALAAAAAASPLFPPTAMLTNPGVFFAMPDMFGANGQNAQAMQAYVMQQAAAQQQQQQSNNNAGGTIVPGVTMGNQQATQHFQQPRQIPVPMGQPTSLQIPQDSSTSTSIQAQMAAAAAAAAAAESVDPNFAKEKAGGKKRKSEMSEGEKAKQNRDRNREHARSTRLRKKAYIQKLKELVEGLHAERTEEVRQRRVAIQHLAEMQNVRRAVIRSFLRFHSNYEKDKRKWNTLLEDEFWLKQPVTPYRCFRRGEIQQECRVSTGVDAILADTSSVAVMIESVGSRSTRWMQIKREAFFCDEEERTGRKQMPRNIDGQNSRFQHAVSSLSASSSNSSNNGSGGEDSRKKKHISNSSASSNERHRDQSTALHDYHANPLPDPKLDSGRSNTSISEDSPEESNASSADDTKRVSTDSSSGDDSAAAIKDRPSKRRKHEGNKTPEAIGGTDSNTSGTRYLPQNIAKRGGIAHNVRPVSAARLSVGNGNDRLSTAPAIPLPPFAGIGKKSQISPVPSTGTSASSLPNSKQNGAEETPTGQTLSNVVGPAVISGDVETSSSNSSRSRPQVRAYYHVNEDDMIIMDDIIMCPFVFRTQEAVLCGALAECVMPGMLRGHFSSRNKLISLECTYDAMGFMQQLERASGSEMTARIIPGSLEMALSPTTTEARVITLAKPPYQIVNVNETWTKMFKYTQMEAEGLELFTLLEGEDHRTAEEPPPAPYAGIDMVNEGRCTCATRCHYDKEGRTIIDFVSSYPLTNNNDEVTHILHVSQELPPLPESVESSMEGGS